MSHYRLAHNVCACASEDGAVFLNVERDEYLGIDADQSRALSLIIDDWPRQESSRVAPDSVAGDVAALAQALCDRGLIVPMSPAHSEPVLGSINTPDLHLCTSQIPIVEAELIPWEHMSWHHIRLGHILRFLQSLLTALVLLHSRHFVQIVDRVPLHSSRAASDGLSLDVPSVVALLSAFFHIRAFFYAPKARCLLDSLTLLEFLSHYDQHPQWVIGVQITPFGSHSWIQHANLVLNGTAEYVRAYTPILAI